MLDAAVEQAVQTLEIIKHERIAAPLDIVFETLLEHLGPQMETIPGAELAMKLEAWPGGRWFRDLGNNTGHLWGHVQVIKPPTLLELCGPMFMSFPAVNHLQYRLTAEGDGTRLKFTHRGFGHIPEDVLENVGGGWEYIVNRIREIAERLKNERKK